MISPHTMPGTMVVALKTGFGITTGNTYTVRGFVLNRHWRTREPDAHVLLHEISYQGLYGEIGFPRDAFHYLDLPSCLTDLQTTQPLDAEALV